MNRTIFQEIYQMKKLLQASTAIIGVAMIASSAHANLEISGTGRLMISLGSDYPGADSMQFDAEGYYIGFSGSKKTDSGLTLSGGAYLGDSKSFVEEGDNIAVDWDKTNFAISGDFGKVEVTNKGDASGLSGTATYLEAAEYGYDGLTPLMNNVTAGGTGTYWYLTNIEVPRGTTRINYYSPNISGFSAGFSMMESGGNSEHDVTKDGAVAPALDADGMPTAAVDVSKGHKSAIALGFKYVSAFGLTFGYGSTSYSQSLTVKNGTTAENGEWSSGWSGTRINLGYKTGPFSAGFTTTTKENDLGKAAGVEGTKLSDGESADANLNNTVIALKYNYGAGSVSFLTKTEDVAKLNADGTKDLTKSENIASSIISVSHTVTPGVNAYFQSVSVEGEFDGSNAKRDSASELILGLTVSF